MSTVTFLTNSTSGATQDFSITIVNEEIVESDETFVLSAFIVNNRGNFTAGGNTASAVIQNDDRKYIFVAFDL